MGLYNSYKATVKPLAAPWWTQMKVMFCGTNSFSCFKLSCPHSHQCVTSSLLFLCPLLLEHHCHHLLSLGSLLLYMVLFLCFDFRGSHCALPPSTSCFFFSWYICPSSHFMVLGGHTSVPPPSSSWSLILTGHLPLSSGSWFWAVPVCRLLLLPLLLVLHFRTGNMPWS